MYNIKYFIFILCFSFCILKSIYPYEYTGHRYITGNFPIFYVNESGTPDCVGEFSAIQNALQTWNAVSTTYISFAYGGTTTNNSKAYDGTNLIMWVENGWRDIFPGSNAIAVNTTWYNPNNGIAYESDILFNGEDYLWSDNGAVGRYDVRNIATHEIGHSVGLGDLYGEEDIEKTMYGYSNTGETKKSSLHTDDEDGARYVNFDPQTSGTLTENQIWMPNLNSNIIGLTNNLNTSSYSLTIKQGITVNLSNYSIYSPSGTLVVEDGATINGLRAKLKNTYSSNYKGLFSRVQTAIDYAGQSDEIHIVGGPYNENLSISNKNSISIYSGTINGTITATNSPGLQIFGTECNAIYLNNCTFPVFNNVNIYGSGSGTGLSFYNTDYNPGNMFNKL